ncbi:DUF2125 domain-containing protein [Roseobacter sp. HKCCA0434]|uniref:DUF2125 domain-containing protein n=1 Tax=Roseobacter sp. HKCCA0434 TaxID=3079297 RepID=UPI002905C5FE|nr:DUF2125 domain-containing protein [Roseobacter sp. HKCCA0434]
MRPLFLPAATVLGLISAANAQIGPDDVVDSMRALDDDGEWLTIQTERRGDGIAITSLSLTIGEALTVDLSGAAYELAPSDDADWDVVGRIDGTVTADVTVRQNGESLTYSFDMDDTDGTYLFRGEPGAIERRAQAQSIVVTFDAEMEEGTVGLIRTTGTQTITDYLSSYVPGGDPSSGRMELSIGRMEGATRAEVDGQLLNRTISFVDDTRAILDWQGLEILTLLGDAEALDAFLEAGEIFDRDTRLSIEQSTGAFRSMTETAVPGAEPILFDVLGDTSRSDADLNEIGVGVAGSVEDLVLKVSGPVIPIEKPSITIAEMAADFTIPLYRSDEVQQMDVGLTLSDVELSDGLWDVIDATGDLDRSELDLVIDTLLGVTLTRSIFDAERDKEIALELNSLDLITAQLDALGAELDITGQIGFETVAGQPLPVDGQLDARATGIDAMIADLISAGALPPPVVQQIRMMTGLMLAPTSEPDSYTSEITFGPGGAITANGVPLQ